MRQRTPQAIRLEIKIAKLELELAKLNGPEILSYKPKDRTCFNHKPWGKLIAWLQFNNITGKNRKFLEHKDFLNMYGSTDEELDEIWEIAAKRGHKQNKKLREFSLKSKSRQYHKAIVQDLLGDEVDSINNNKLEEIYSKLMSKANELKKAATLEVTTS